MSKFCIKGTVFEASKIVENQENILPIGSTANVVLIDSSIAYLQGAAADIVSPLDLPRGHLFDLNNQGAAATINYIKINTRISGSAIRLILRGASITLKHNVADPPSGSLPILLASETDFTVLGFATIDLMMLNDGIIDAWVEVGRSVIINTGV